MIAAYAQASERQGLDVALDGERVALHDLRFEQLRDRGLALNLKTPSRTVDGVEVRCGRGVLRLDMSGGEESSAGLSPVVIIVSGVALDAGSAEVSRRAVATVEAIGRTISPRTVEAAIVEAERLVSGRARLRVIVGSVVAVAVVSIASVFLFRQFGAAGAE
ncbi:hypothetical protein [Microbacterium lacticum]